MLGKCKKSAESQKTCLRQRSKRSFLSSHPPGHPKVPCFSEVFCYIKPTKKHSFGCLGIGQFIYPHITYLYERTCRKVPKQSPKGAHKEEMTKLGNPLHKLIIFLFCLTLLAPIMARFPMRIFFTSPSSKMLLSQKLGFFG